MQVDDNYAKSLEEVQFPDFIVRKETLPDGVIEAYDENGIMRMAVIPEGVGWARSGIIFMGMEGGGYVCFDSEHHVHADDQPAVVYFQGRRAWWRHGQRHRDPQDGAALIDESLADDQAVYQWFVDGKKHRDPKDGPAVIYPEGVEYWVEGQLHREDGPAIEFNNGDQVWVHHGKYHRDDGPAVIRDGDKEYWRGGQLYRSDGPAIERRDGTNIWASGDIAGPYLHRSDGPAVENLRNPQVNQWWFNNQQYQSEEEWQQAIEVASKTKLL